jgi:hypothetical protein
VLQDPIVERHERMISARAITPEYWPLSSSTWSSTVDGLVLASPALGRRRERGQESTSRHPCRRGHPRRHGAGLSRWGAAAAAWERAAKEMRCQLESAPGVAAAANRPSGSWSSLRGQGASQRRAQPSGKASLRLPPSCPPTLQLHRPPRRSWSGHSMAVVAVAAAAAARRWASAARASMARGCPAALS